MPSLRLPVHRLVARAVTTVTIAVLSVAAPATRSSADPSPAPVDTTQSVFAHGAATFAGSTASTPLAAPLVGIAATPSAKGYWRVASDGGIFSFGDAVFQGSTGAIHLNQPIVGMAATPSGNGYWLVASDGGIFSFGDAVFQGSTGAIHLNQPIVGMAATPSGHGYWLVASDGGIFSFGDAVFQGSTGAIHLNQPIVGMAATPSGHGYWLVASDGGIFSFGDAVFQGSTGAIHLNQPIVAMAPSPSGAGYWLAASDGGVFNFGDAPFLGSEGGSGLSSPVVAMAASASQPGFWLATAGRLGAPAAVAPIVSPPLPGEGSWSAAGRSVGGAPVVWTTSLRPSGEPAASIAAINPGGVRFVVYAGSDQPSGNWSASTVIDPSARPNLVAAFESGFRLDASNGGYYQDGRAAIGLRQGAASLIVRQNGSATVGAWGRDASMTADISEVRQNLDLLVDNSQPAGNVANIGAWGATLGNVTFTWRSGLGVDRFGRLIFVAGPGEDPAGLAEVLIAAGAVRAMELDINPMWPLLVTYTGGPDPASVAGTKLRGDMYYGADHYFGANERDFVAAFAR